MAYRTCDECGLHYDDTYRWTYCPHEEFEMHTTVHRQGKPDVIAHTVEELHRLMKEG